LAFSSKAATKQTIAACFRYSGAAALRKKLSGGNCVILSYGRVTQSHPFECGVYTPKTGISLGTFENHIKHMAKSCKILSLAEIIRRYVASEPYPKRSVAITLDHAWSDNFEFALPILKKYKVQATLFIAAQLVGKDGTFWTERAAHAAIQIKKRRNSLVQAFPEESMPPEAKFIISLLLSDPRAAIYAELVISNLLNLPPERLQVVLHFFEELAEEPWQGNRSWATWQEVREMVSSGHIDIGSLGDSDFNLNALDQDMLDAEIELPRSAIQKEIGMLPEMFAYPNGFFDENIIRKVSKAGYSGAFTLLPGFADFSSNTWTMPRVRIYQGLSDSISELECLLSGFF